VVVAGRLIHSITSEIDRFAPMVLTLLVLHGGEHLFRAARPRNFAPREHAPILRIVAQPRHRAVCGFS